MSEKITVLGAGSWGTALAQLLGESDCAVTLWDRNPELLDEITKSRKNVKYHPGFKLSASITVEKDIAKAVKNASSVLLAIPSDAIRDITKEIKSSLLPNAILINSAKGIDSDTLQTLYSVVMEILGESRAKQFYAVLSGPSFATEVMKGLPTAVTVASFNLETCKKVQELFHTPMFRVYASDDVIGVEIAGALKNVIAIVTGAADEYGFGYNARAGLLTRGLAEITQIGQALGANPFTFAGLSGMGDLILTCTSDLSRNRRVGTKLAQGKSLKQIMKEVGQVAEGIRTTKNAYLLSEKLKLDLPIFKETYLAMYEGKPPEQAIRDLLSRAPEFERSH